MSHDVRKYYAERVNEKVRTDFLWQVGKTVGGKVVPQVQIDLILKAIAERLELSENDVILDAGCGNGLLTKRISEFVKEITGIELTQDLYEIAAEYNSSENTRYINASVFDLDVKQHKNKYSKVYLYEVLQHLSLIESNRLIELIKMVTKEKAVIYFGGILDIEKRLCFFNTDERRDCYFDSILSGTDQLGTWYYMDYFRYLSKRHGLVAECYFQDSELYTSHYRFDCVMQKK